MAIVNIHSPIYHNPNYRHDNLLDAVGVGEDGAIFLHNCRKFFIFVGGKML